MFLRETISRGTAVRSPTDPTTHPRVEPGEFASTLVDRVLSELITKDDVEYHSHNLEDKGMSIDQI